MSQVEGPVLAIVGFGPGIGVSVAHRFGREGFRIAAMARSQEHLDHLGQELVDAGIPYLGLKTDASDEASIADAFSRIHSEWGEVDVLLYNAVTVHPGLPTEVSASDMVADFRVGVVGALVAVQQVVGDMKRRGSGTIFLTGGGFALMPAPSLASLGVAKAGLRNLSASLALELENSGVRVATLTIKGMVSASGPLSPEFVASQFWQLYTEPSFSGFERLVEPPEGAPQS